MGANESSEIDPNKRERSIPTLELAKKSASELCFARMSIRSYDESKSIDSTAMDAIQMFLKDPIKMTFPKEGSKAQRIELLCKDEAVKGKLGTYGIISGAKYFLVGITESEASSLEMGFVFERLVLLCTSLGLGTCWIGGTFNKSQFKANLTLNEHEQIFAVSPVGYPLDKEKLIGRAFASGHNKRKPFNQICFKGLNYDENNGFESPESVGPIGIALEAARWSPSAINSQPWRLFVQPNKDDSSKSSVHFFIVGPSDHYQINDCGIALSNFTYVTESFGDDKRGEIRILTGEDVPAIQGDPEKTKKLIYCASWVEL